MFGLMNNIEQYDRRKHEFRSQEFSSKETDKQEIILLKK